MKDKTKEELIYELASLRKRLADLETPQDRKEFRDEREREERQVRVEEKYWNLFTKTSAGLYQATPGGRFITVNPALAKMCGYDSPEDMVNGITDIAVQFYVNPDDRIRFMKIIERDYIIEDFECWVLKKDGGALWVSATSRCVQDVAGRILNYEGIIEDISRRKEMEAALELADRKYRNIFENAIEGIYQSTPTGRYLTINPSFAKMLGYSSPAEMIATITDIGRQLYVNPEEREIWKKMLDEYGVIENYEVQFNRKDGDKLWIAFNARTVKDAEGHISYYEGMAEDITTRKRTEEALKESEERFATAFRFNPAPVVISTIEQGRFLDVNEKWLHLMGYTREEMIGHTSSELSLWAHYDDRTSAIQKLIGQGFLRDEYFKLRTKGGKSLDILLSTEIIKYKGNDVMLSLFNDITERKQFEAERERLILELQKALADVKTLSGLIPICASCKNIRDDKGYWTQIESYIKAHSLAEFSHGVCPDCVRKLYPEYHKKKGNQ